MSQEINSIIDQLAEIDSASAKIMQQAQQEKAKYAEYINGQKKDFDNTLQAKVDREVDAYKAETDAHNQEQIKICKEQCAADVEKLEQSFKSNGSQWADEIFDRIIRE